MTLPRELMERALDMVAEGIPRKLISKELGLNRHTLNEWVRKRTLKDPDYTIPSKQLRVCEVLVSRIRESFIRVDNGELIREAAAAMRLRANTIRVWRKNPMYLEATYEYDPAFQYDPDDLLDRAVVAHHLCTRTPDVEERWELLAAVVGFDAPELDDRTTPHRGQTRRKKGLLR